MNLLLSCALQAIKVLILKSKILQKEIVGQGRGTASATEFYKKHHRWTEGLISAAKAVGWGANVLVYVFIISRTSAKAERDLSSQSGLFLCVELGNPLDPSHTPLEMAYPLGIS